MDITLHVREVVTQLRPIESALKKENTRYWDVKDKTLPFRSGWVNLRVSDNFTRFKPNPAHFRLF